MDNEKIVTFFRQFKHQTYNKGEILIRADDDPAGVYYLTKGVVIEYLITKKGNEAILEFFIPPSIFPLSWALNNDKNSRYYEAYEDVEVFRAPKEVFTKFLSENADIQTALLNRMCEDFEYLKKRLTSWMSGDAYERVVEELLVLTQAAKKIYKQPGPVRIPHFIGRYAAARTGLTQETVSREIKKLKEKNLVDLHNNTLIIKDVEKLELELDEY